MLAVTPLLTMLFGAVIAALPTGYVNQDSVDALSLSGAAMVVAGLAAEGTTTISGVHHIDRGYDGFVDTLRALGATIDR